MKEQLPHHAEEEAYRVAYLIAGFIRKTLTEKEHDELDAWVEASDENMKLFEDLTDEENIEANLAWIDQVQTKKALQETTSQLEFSSEKPVKRPVSIWYYAAAASLILAVAAIFLVSSKKTNVSTENAVAAKVTDVPPGGNRAILTLSNGSSIDLTNATNGSIMKQDGAEVIKTGDGQIAYDANNDTVNAAYNTLTIPKGGQYNITLSDGTKVWLNAASNLRFPTIFSGSLRIVELQGEGYFEVAKNKAKPFLVKLSSSDQVKVLGTHFNLSSYDEEKIKTVTLVEGSVRVTSNRNQLTLKPGQQATLIEDKLSLEDKPDVEEVMGWKKGQFVFHDAPIQSIMQQAARWYDVNVIYKTNNAELFNATVSRSEPLSKLLHFLETTDKIHFKIENKTIYVLP